MLRRWMTRVAASLGALMIDATVAFGRAGGGGGYSGGGGSSSSSSSSSSYSGGGSSGGGGGSADLTILDWLIVLVFVVGFILKARRSNGPSGSRKRSGARQRESEAHAASIRERDPGFDLAAFTKRVERAFLQIQEAWSNQDLSDIRGFVSDGLHERFSIQLREQAELGYRNRMADVRVHDATLVDARSLAHFDVVSVRIAASASDWREDAGTGREISGTRRSEYFVEVWSFLRGRGQSSPEGEGLLGGQCPNCSAPVEPSRAWACDSCGSALDSAPPDWVLTEITQSSEWRIEDRSEPEWLKRATTRDPGLTCQQIEDRASVLFWRLMDSDRTASVAELESVARPSFLELQQLWLAGTAGHFTGDCAVGSVDLHGIIEGQEWDLALVEVRWAGSVFERVRGGGAKQTPARSLRRDLLVMARRADAKSQIGRCIVSAHCAACGGPDEGALDGACGFCGEPLNDGRDWLIDRFVSRGDDEAALLIAEARSEPVAAGRSGSPAASPPPGTTPAPGGSELFAWCLKLAYADDRLALAERERLGALAERLGIPGREARALRKAAQFGRLAVESPSNAEQADVWISTLTRLAESDGALDAQERDVIARIEGYAREV